LAAFSFLETHMAEATQATGPAPVAGTPAGATLDAAVEAELAAMEAQDEEPPPESAEGAEGEGEEVEQEGDEPQEGDEQDEETQQQLKLAEGEVEYTTEGGKKYAIPKEVADNMLRQQDYTRNMQRLGEVAQHQERASQQLGELYQAGEYLQAHRVRIQQIDEAEGLLHQFLQQNPNLSQTDELEFNKAVAQLNLLQHHRKTSQEAVTQAQQQHAQFQAEQTAQRVARVMPAFQQMGVQMQHLKAVEGHCRAMGLSQETITFLNEAREPAAIVMAMESMAYRALMAQKAQATSRVDKAKGSGVLRPGASSTGGQPRGNGSNAAKRLAATGSVNDAVANEMALMARSAKAQRQR
jgi:hypothetical protein